MKRLASLVLYMCVAMASAIGRNAKEKGAMRFSLAVGHRCASQLAPRGPGRQHPLIQLATIPGSASSMLPAASPTASLVGHLKR